VSLQEQMQGWLAFLARARSSAQIIIAYNELEEMFRSYCEMKVLRYSDDAEDRFVALRKKRVRIGSMDLRIAAIALSHGAIVLTRNVTDFRQVPGLVVEDWTA
jgi:tRNA(fMet)-specific endonuclease VapC